MRRQWRSSRDGGSSSRPTWWLLDAIAALLVAVVALVDTRVDGEVLRTILEVLTVLGGFGLIGLWLRRHRIAMDLEQGRRRE